MNIKNLVVNNANALTSLTHLTEHSLHSFSHSTSNISTIIKPAGQNNMPYSQIKQRTGKQAKQQVLMQNKHCPVDVIRVNSGSFSIHVVTSEVMQYDKLERQMNMTCIHWHWEDTCKHTHQKARDNTEIKAK